MLLKRSNVQPHTTPKGIGLAVAKHAENSLSFAEEGIFLELRHCKQSQLSLADYRSLSEIMCFWAVKLNKEPE